MRTETATWVGQTLAGGRYRVTAKLGEGGMGHVYRAHDRNLDTEVVIKVPRPAMLEDPEFAGRFAREIRSLVKLVHPHIVKVMDVGEHERLPFAVMQYLPGGSLRDRQRIGPGGQAVIHPVQDLGTWLEDVAAALDFIHRKGYIHRDVKPENILFDAEGHAYLSDFGVAKVLAERGDTKQKTVLTGAGVVLGTPQYMAPELIMGQPYGGRVDQYALAVMVYELLSGHYPFDGTNSTTIFVQHATQPPPPLESVLPSISRRVAGAVHKALAKDPGERFPDCASFARAMLEGIGKVPVPTGGASTPRTRVTCPGCRKVFSLPPRAEGKRLRCPACKMSFEASRAMPAEATDGSGAEAGTGWPAQAGKTGKAPLPNQAPSAFPQMEEQGQKGHIHEANGPTLAELITGRRLWPWLASVVGLALAVLVIVIASRRQPQPQPPTDSPSKSQTPTAEEAGWTQLFNGKDLAGWKSSPGSKGNWKVEGQVLTGHCPEGYDYLFSQRGNYENYHLRIEARIRGAQKGGVGAVFFRSSFGPGQYPDGYMVNMSNTAARTGSLFVNIERKWTILSYAKSTHLPDEWFRMEVYVNGDRIFTKVNDSVEVDFSYTPLRYSRGHIAVGILLAVEAPRPDPNTFLDIRKIEIKELPPGKR